MIRNAAQMYPTKHTKDKYKPHSVAENLQIELN